MASLTLPNKLPPGTVAEATSAESFNKLIDALDQLSREVASLRQATAGAWKARVESVQAGATYDTLGTGEALPSECTYTIRVLGRPELPLLTGITPTLGRNVVDDSVLIWPAPVGKEGWVWQVPNGDGTCSWMLALQEGDTLGDCEQGGA